MQEAKQTFPGNPISHGLFASSALGLGGFIVYSILQGGIVQSGTEFLGIDGTYYLGVVLVTVVTLSHQHKAVFTKKADEDIVHFWKQFTPYFKYARRECKVKDLSYRVEKQKHTHRDTETGMESTSSTFTTYVYEGEEKIFVYSDKTDYFREILGKGPRRASKKEEGTLGLGGIVLLGILPVLGVLFLFVGIYGLYETYLGSGMSDEDDIGGFQLIVFTFIGLFFILIPAAVAWSHFANRRLLAADPATSETPLHDAEEWWDPKSRLERGEVDLVIKNASAGEIRASLLILGAFAVLGLPMVLGFTFIFFFEGSFFIADLGFDPMEVLYLLVSEPVAFQATVLSLFFFTSFLGVFLFAFYSGFKSLASTEVKWVLASGRGAMEIHYVSWRGLVDIVHLEATEITAIHQTTHPSWAGPPTDGYIIAGWKIFRAPLHGDASRLCELLGIELKRTAPNLADLYVKQGDMSGKKPREALQDAEFEGYRDRQRPFGAWFLSAFVWGFALILSVFLEISDFGGGSLLVTGLGLWVTWRMFSWAFRRPVLRVLHTKGSLVVEGVSFGRRGPREGWPIAEASHIVAVGKKPPEGTNREWFTLVGVNSRGGKWGPAWEYDLEYLLPRRARGGDVVEDGSVAMGIAGGIADAIGIPIVTRPYEKMKFQQLKEEARGRGLEVGGRKADLVARLYESDAMARQG